MASVKVMQTGRLGADPEMKKVGRGAVKKTRVSMLVISNERWRDEWTEKIVDAKTAIRWIAWGARGESIVKYLKRGAWVAVSGRVRNDNYEDRQGRKTYGFQFTVEAVEFVERAPVDETTVGEGV